MVGDRTRDNVFIILPESIPVMINKKNQDVQIDKEEYSIYFKNIIYPFKDEYDIQVDCMYGMNLGHCWRLNQFSEDMKDFDLTIKIYGDFGKLLAQKTCKISNFTVYK